MSTFLTICLYSIFYSSVIFLFKIADEAKSKFKKKRIIFLGIIFVALFASLRDVSVGTDTTETVRLYFVEQYTRKLDFTTFSEFLHSNLFYYVIANVIYTLGLGTRTFLFLLEVCTVAPVAVSAYKKRKQIPLHITLGIFLLLYFQLSFNWIRQSAASAFILLTLVNVQEKCKKQAVFTAIMAVMLHSSAIFGLILLAFSYIFMRVKNRYWRFACGIGCIVIFISLLTQWEAIVSFGITSGILPTTYAGYLRVFSGQTTVESWFLVGIRTYVEFAIRILLVVLPFILKKRDASSDEQIQLDFNKIITVIGLIIYGYVLLNMHSAYGNRISYAVEYIQLINLGSCYVRTTKTRGVIPLRNMIIIGAVSFYNIWLYYILGWHDTVPFVFGF